MTSFETVELVEVPLVPKRSRELEDPCMATASDIAVLSKIIGEERAAVEVLRWSGGLKGLASKGRDQLERKIGRKAATSILAALELGRRGIQAGETRPRLCTPEAIFRYLLPILGGRSREAFHVLSFNARNTLLSDVRIAEGSVDSCPVDPREVFAAALFHRPAGIVVAHNHPSGDPTPSGQDVELTRNLARGCVLLGFKLLDHLVLGDGSYVSMAERGLFTSAVGIR